MRVEIEDGKYTYQFHPDGRSEVLRHGEPWRDTVGDKFIYCMASEIEQLRQRVQELTAERNELLKAIAIAGPVMDAHAGPSRLADFHAAIASVKEKQNEN